MGEYYIKTKGDERGPYAGSQLRSMWDSGLITSDTLFRTCETDDWKPIAGFLDGTSTEAPPSSNEAAAPVVSPATEPPKKTQTGAKVLLIVLLIGLAILFFGNVHVITGGSLDSPRIVQKQSFGLSETFINLDTITSMPWIAAKSRFPLSCAVLQRERMIESDAAFRERQNREMKDELDKALRNLSR